MLKRTKGRILLSLLVVTGFAGTVNNTAPTKQERRLAVMYLKDSRAELQKTLKGLSETQMDFRPSAGERSIREWFYHLAGAEAAAWQILEEAMSRPASSEKRSALKYRNDADLLRDIAEPPAGHERSFCIQSGKKTWKSLPEAAAEFKQSRMHHLKYIKTTTEDLRNHFVDLPFGTLDCYQFLLFLSAHIDQHQQAIDGLISHPGFPEN